MSDGIKISKNWKTAFKIITRGVTVATRDALNAQALASSKAQIKRLESEFILRNGWTAGSIFPKMGSKFGLVSDYQNTPRFMFSRSGTVADYLQDQESGFTVSDPYAPLNSARIGKSKKRVIQRRSHLKNLKKEKTITPSGFKNVQGTGNKIRALVGMARAVKWKGVIRIKREGMGLPAGFYRLKKNNLVLLRVKKTGTHRRPAIHWHQKSSSKIPKSTSQNSYNKAMNRKLSSLS